MDTIGRHAGLSEGETKVLDWLEAGLKNEPGQIIVEPPIKSTELRYNRWPDFILVSPVYGVCILEVKAYWADEFRRVEKVRDLVTVKGFDRYRWQIRQYGYLVSDLLNNKEIKLTKGVIFPFILESDRVANAIREFDNEITDSFLMFNDALSWDCTLQRLIGNPMPKKLRAPELEDVLYSINPYRVLEHNYANDTENLNKKIMVFDEEQMKCIDGIKHGHYIINGLPGTGKTKMLVAIANRELAKDKTVLYTCFNQPLKDSIVPYLGEEVVKSTRGLYHQNVQQYGINYKNDDKWLDKAIPLLLEKEIHDKYDVLLIDEYQDLNDDDYAILLKFLKPDGLLVLAGDRLQNIMGAKKTWSSKGIKVLGRNHSMFLSAPYRTDPSVVDFALKFICNNAALEKIAKRYFKDHDFEHDYGDFSNLSKHIKFSLKDVNEMNIEIGRIIEENPDADVLIVTCYENQRFKIPFRPDSQLQIEPYTRVKGLESDIVILYNIDFFKEWRSEMKLDERMKSVFSALCRARGDVYIHGTTAKDFYSDLRSLYLECSKKKAA